MADDLTEGARSFCGKAPKMVPIVVGIEKARATLRGFDLEEIEKIIQKAD